VKWDAERVTWASVLLRFGEQRPSCSGKQREPSMIAPATCGTLPKRDALTQKPPILRAASGVGKVVPVVIFD
jgi:hypothetical protein